MNQLRNTVHLIGNLGRDPETRTFGDNKSVTRFSLATTESYLNQQGERVSTTQWHTCVVWGKLGENMKEVLSKGKQVMINGKLAYRDYKGEDGVSRRYTEIIVNDFLLIESRQLQQKAG